MSLPDTIAPASLPDLVRRRLREVKKLISRAKGRTSTRQIQALGPIFFKNAPEAFVLGYRPADLRALVTSAYRVMVRSGGGAIQIAVFNPDPATHGFSSDRTILQISAPDGPFYVTSIRERLRLLGHTVVHLIHPIIPAAWDKRGNLADMGDPRLPARQSLIHVELDRVDDRKVLDRIEREIRAVFSDLQQVTGDFEGMCQPISQACRDLDSLASASSRPEMDRSELKEFAAFLKWMEDANFVFLGYREYDLVIRGGQKFISLRRGSGLGLLGRDRPSRFYRPVSLSRLPATFRSILGGHAPGAVTQTSRQSPVYRNERMIGVSLKRWDARGRVIGIRRWIGLFTNRVEGFPPAEIPILRDKFRQVVSAESVEPRSQNFREMYGIFSSYPKDFLFGARLEDLRREIRAAMAAQSARDFKVIFRPMAQGDQINVMIIMSKDRFSRDVRLKIESKLRLALDASAIDYSLSMGQEGEEFARLYFTCQTHRKTPVQGSFADLERDLWHLTKTWPDQLMEELVGRISAAGAPCAGVPDAGRRGSREGLRLFKLYGPAFSVEYHAHTSPSGALHDISRLESLFASASLMGIDLELFNSKLDTDCTRLKVYHLHSKLPLSDVMPMLTDHGIRVIDEVSNSVRVANRPVAFIHTFRIQHQNAPVDLARVGHALTDSLQGSIRKTIEYDPLSSLILQAQLIPREVSLIRMYRNFLHQIVPVHTLRSIDAALIRNPRGAAILAGLFKARFDPAFGAASSRARRGRVAAVSGAFEDFLDSVADLLEDRIFRILANAMESTVRTNYFQSPERRTIGIKIRSAGLHNPPRPVPLFEIFVYDQNFEGVHLRGGRIARGGIRHSDRRDDFRTEILGLMKTQTVKNAIIVPVGAKGGFVVKDWSDAGEKKSLDAVADCYRSFIRTILDVTDNLIGSRVVHALGCVIYDEPDPYLVVAADKGTAGFSDIANQVSAEAGFWLGDAFASGGKNGYDHKRLGITARGAWECIRHHLSFVQSTGQSPLKSFPPTRTTLPITCVGIGDMSGDVFGNGLLISPSLHLGPRRIVPVLLAAFNHESIFIDPDPNPERAMRERLRLFRLTRSRWSDYDHTAISAGGGVYPRQSKKIVLSRPAARLLGMAVGEWSGEEVVQAILKMKVDLLYNGGIGTYVKSSGDRHTDVGDSANDRVRINDADLACQIVGEGGNMGMTQNARIGFSRRGGRVNTDAVDNSAGVDMSDHEVNLKILLRSLNLSETRRRRWMRRLTDSVSQAVLNDNILQSRILSMEEWRSRRELSLYPKLMDDLARTVGFSREMEGLPADKEIMERVNQGVGLFRPELAVLLAWVKMSIDRSILELSSAGSRQSDGMEVSAAGDRPSRLADDSILGPFLAEYFPLELVRSTGTARLNRHCLADQITSTCAANAFVNRAGLTMAFRLSEQIGVSIPEVVRGYFVADRLVLAERLRRRLTSGPAEHLALDELERGLAGILLWLFKEYRRQDIAAALVRFSSLPRLLPKIGSLLSETEMDEFANGCRQFVSAGIPRRAAIQVMQVKMAPRLLELQVASARLRNLR